MARMTAEQVSLVNEFMHEWFDGAGVSPAGRLQVIGGNRRRDYVAIRHKLQWSMRHQIWEGSGGQMVIIRGDEDPPVRFRELSYPNIAKLTGVTHAAVLHAIAAKNSQEVPTPVPGAADAW